MYIKKKKKQPVKPFYNSLFCSFTVNISNVTLCLYPPGHKDTTKDLHLRSAHVHTRALDLTLGHILPIQPPGVTTRLFRTFLEMTWGERKCQSSCSGTSPCTESQR